VILGVAGESISEFGHFSQDDEGQKRRRTIGKLSALVLIAGLAIELFCGVRTTELSDEVIADLQQESSATFRAAGAAIERASKALLEQETLKSENLKLEALIQPRSLSLKQQHDIGVALLPFKGRKVVISWSDELESYNFSTQIMASLKFSKLDVKPFIGSSNPPTYFIFPRSIPVAGVKITWSPGQKDLGIALERALCKIGHVHKLSLVQGSTTTTEPVVISVYSKPFDVLQDEQARAFLI